MNEKIDNCISAFYDHSDHPLRSGVCYKNDVNITDDNCVDDINKIFKFHFVIENTIFSLYQTVIYINTIDSNVSFIINEYIEEDEFFQRSLLEDLVITYTQLCKMKEIVKVITNNHRSIFSNSFDG